MSIDSCFVITMEHDASGCTKKSRKPYTLTKQRESWTNDEHERFIKALQLYNRDWKKIESYVGTKTVVQIRSHAQKYFQKVIKSGSTDAIPPPRPKRRATDPPLASQASCVFPDTKQSRVVLEGPARANSAKAEVDSDEVQHNSKQEMASLRSNDAVDAPIQLESARAVVSSQHLQHVYLFLASLFSQTPSNHTAMLAGLSERDRQLVTRLLKVSGEELAAQQQQLQQSTGQLQQPHSATHSEEQQQQQQQSTPAIPGAQAAQDLAAAVQESLATAAKQHFTAGKGQKGTTLQSLASMSLPVIKKEAGATGMLGPESINGDQAKEAAAAATAAAESSMPDSTPITDTGQPVVLTQAHEQQAQQQSEQERLQGIAHIQVTSTKDTHMLDALRHVGPVPAAEQLCSTVPGDPAVASAPESASLGGSQQQTAGQTAALQQNVSPGPAAAAAALPAAPAGDNEEAQPSNTLVMAQAAKCANQAIGSDEQHSQQAGTDFPAAAAAAIAATDKSVPPQTLCPPEPAQQPPMQCVGAAAGAAGGSAMGFHAYDVPAPLN